MEDWVKEKNVNSQCAVCSRDRFAPPRIPFYFTAYPTTTTTTTTTTTKILL